MRSLPFRYVAALLGGALVIVSGCSRLGLRRDASEQRAAVRTREPVPLAPVRLTSAVATGPRCRLFLDEAGLRRLQESAHLRTPAFVFTQTRADEALAAPIASGYQGFEWADALASSALLWRATGDERYAASALRYLRALLDDRLAVGDGLGGAEVVRHDSGYGIRTFGAYAALGYDWLRGAPGMTPELATHVGERLNDWLSWYEKEGYLRDRPTANYYWGYLTALSLAGVALSGENAQAASWLERAREELSRRVLPLFRDQLRGGGWPEGWQYGEYTAFEIALVARALGSAGVNVVDKLPWLGQTVTQHTHALLPDEGSVYDGGTWGEHPAKPSALAMTAIGWALAGTDDARAAEARWLVAQALPPLRREQAWLGLLADAPGAEQRSPRRADATSLHLPGQGLTLVRSSWSKDAVWASFQAGPPLAEDHQDADQGHFELVRGSDALLVDGGGSEGSATVNHNTLLIDDRGDVMNYTPNQGVWGEAVKTTRFGDDGVVALAVGELGEAYAPKCAISGCKKRSLERFTRSFVFVRPSLLVVQDELTLSSADYGATWAAHLTRSPELHGNQVSAVIGGSRVELHQLEPSGALLSAPHEPTPSGDGSHRLNQPWGPMWRLEVKSPQGTRERSFLHAIVAAAATEPPSSAERLSGDGVHGAFVRSAGGSAAVLFARAEGDAKLEAKLPGSASQVVLAGLTPGKHYRFNIDGPSCTLTARGSRDSSDPTATSGGFLRGSAACSTR